MIYKINKVVTALEKATSRPWFRNFVNIGGIMALVISWGLHKSVIWALLNGAAGWFYVIYYLIYLAGN